MIRTLLACVTALAAAPAAAACRLALALALDVSGSVDAHEYRLQLEGIAAALDTSAVQNALFSDPRNTVELLVFEWSGPEDQAVILNWTALNSKMAIDKVQQSLMKNSRRDTSPGTAIGSALSFGLTQLEQRASCRARVLDISGDGLANIGPDPTAARDQMQANGVTVNALVIGSQNSQIRPELVELSAYYRANVITGTDAFVQTALGFEAYAEAMAKKLARELGSISLATAIPVDGRQGPSIDQ